MMTPSLLPRQLCLRGLAAAQGLCVLFAFLFVAGCTKEQTIRVEVDTRSCSRSVGRLVLYLLEAEGTEFCVRAQTSGVSGQGAGLEVQGKLDKDNLALLALAYPGSSPCQGSSCLDGGVSKGDSSLQLPDLGLMGDNAEEPPSPELTCGDDLCAGSETPATCKQDCGYFPGPTLPQGSCAQGGESGTLTCCWSQPSCQPDDGLCIPPMTMWCCGDGICHKQLGESCASCPTDCHEACDLPRGCGDGRCDTLSGESCATCFNDCSCNGEQSSCASCYALTRFKLTGASSLSVSLEDASSSLLEGGSSCKLEKGDWPVSFQGLDAVPPTRRCSE